MEFSTDAPKKSLSKFSLSDLAFRSALELRKASEGSEYDSDTIDQLMAALAETTKPLGNQGTSNFIDPGYFEPYEKLYRTQTSPQTPSIDNLQNYFKTQIESLEALKSQSIDEKTIQPLVKFCFSLHRELVSALSAENKIVSRRNRSHQPSQVSIG